MLSPEWIYTEIETTQSLLGLAIEIDGRRRIAFMRFFREKDNLMIYALIFSFSC